MDNARLEGKWTEIKGRLREAYAVLTEDDLEEARGNREKLEGKLQQRLGKSKDDAREMLDSILAKI